MKKKSTTLVISMIFLLVSIRVFAHETDKKKRKDPIKCFEREAKQLGKILSMEDLEKLIEDFQMNKPLNRWLSIIRIKEYIKPLKDRNAYSFCIIGELMKRVGNYQAEDYYKKAIDAAPDEPAYELFYAEYLRNFRGPQHPLFPHAEEHYFEALKKLRRLKQAGIWQGFDDETKTRVERGLIALYQQDGFPLNWKSNIVDSKQFLEKPPLLFLATINRYAESATDFGEVDDTRSFTSEALFASSKTRLNRDLTDNELREIIRAREQFETLERLRLRYGYWPAFDIFFKYLELEDAQITNFYEPNKFNDVELNEYGIALEKPLNFSPFCDAFVKGTYKRTHREGIIEFLPDTEEDISHFEAEVALSRFFGPDKATLEFTYVYQDIDPDIPNPPKRDREIAAATLTYQVFRPVPVLQPTLEKVFDKRFETRGLDVFAGVARDEETYGETDVTQDDVFIGTSLKGLGDFNVTIQSTIFTYEVEGDKSRDNSQYRTNLTLLYRIIDEEEQLHVKKDMAIQPAFLHLVIPFRHDVAVDGPEDFENFKAGIELDGKFFSAGIRGTTFLVSFRYDYQRFFNLDKDLNLYSFNVSVGF